MPRERFFHLPALPVVIQEKLRGGEGPAQCRILFDPAVAAPDSPFTALGVNTLPPGSSIGMHTHTVNEEIYIILSGQGEYADTNGTRYPVRAGDITYCPKGESHGLFNTSAEDLTMVGIISQKN